MDEPTTIRLPALAGGQAESWRALIEIAPRLGRHWLLIGGQMVFLHEVERQSSKVHPTNDIDLVVDLRVEPTALDHTHAVLADAGFEQDQPSPEGVALIGGTRQAPPRRRRTRSSARPHRQSRLHVDREGAVDRFPGRRAFRYQSIGYTLHPPYDGAVARRMMGYEGPCEGV